MDQVSRERVNKFLEENINVFENVDSLYEDSVFLPAYDIKFSSGSVNTLTKRKEDLVAHLAKMKEDEFPKKSIELMYEEFLKSSKDNGVLKARAIVTHGKHYKKNDKKTIRRIAECNPYAAKWITKLKKYRRVFAMPVTDKRTGKNRYFLRLDVRVPTDAKFPVYDVNIVLPRELAKNASKKKWYNKITMNKKQLKNEGRFTITAPTKANKYQCQITPVRMKKNGSNLLDITFTHNSFKVFPISVMVQKPIIKKN